MKLRARCSCQACNNEGLVAEIATSLSAERRAPARAGGKDTSTKSNPADVGGKKKGGLQ
jgi:hypothetical protein